MGDPRARPRLVHNTSIAPVHDDELAHRIRSLEAERLRPVPPPPPKTVRTDGGLRALRAAGDTYRDKGARD